MPKRALLVLVLAICIWETLASFEVELGGMKIVHPSNTYGRMDVALANFGEPKYGATMVGEIVYPHPSAQYSSHAYQCKPVGCNYGCSFFNESTPAFKIDKKPGRNYIMLLDRGPRDHTDLTRPCYFVDKAWHAQAAGADALLVINDGPGDLSTAVAPKDEDSAREAREMRIPAALISQRDGDRLRELLKKGGDAAVQVALNWTDLMPHASQVAWDFWTNANDECGPLCEKQSRFVRDFKGMARKLEQASLVTFSPHYLIWVCQYGADSDECRTQCIRNGAYCCPDPEDDITRGYTGAEVLLMNVRSLCLARVAKDAGEPGLWWEYVDRMGGECRMADKKFTPECSEKVFKDVTAGTKLAGAGGLKAWRDCLDFGPTTGDGKIKLLDEELAAQTGDDAETTIAILPTVRVNRRQYRGALTAPSVLRAICAGFPTGSEPAVCTEEWVSDNECREGNAGWEACNSGFNSTHGRTRCVNTFTGYSCECGDGFLKVVDKATGVDTCSEINECLTTSIPATNKDCACERCACINTVGSYNCTGPLANYCTKERDWGGCWRGTVKGRFYHACQDDVRTFKWAGQYGIVNDSMLPFQCSCPPCFRETPSGGCEPKCDLSHCRADLGGCLEDLLAEGVDVPRGAAGLSAGGVFGLLLFAVAASVGVMYGAYSVYLRHRMAADMRSILEEYVPLSSAPGGGGRGGAGGGAGSSGLGLGGSGGLAGALLGSALGGLGGSGRGSFGSLGRASAASGGSSCALLPDAFETATEPRLSVGVSTPTAAPGSAGSGAGTGSSRFSTGTNGSSGV